MQVGGDYPVGEGMKRLKNSSWLGGRHEGKTSYIPVSCTLLIEYIIKII